MSEDVMLQEAVDAIRQGQRARARDLLTRLLKADANNSDYWVWMSSVVETVREQVYCLKTALKLDPDNQTIRQGLRLLGAIPAEGEVRPVVPVRRKWNVKVQEVRELSALGRIWANPFVRLAVLGLTAFLVVVLVGFGLYYQGAWRRRTSAIIPTRTPGPSPTYTLTPTAINETPLVPTTQPTFVGLPPLWALLEATYTPTPLYVNTPHVSNESFSMAQRSYARGDVETALANLRQAKQMDPKAPDIPYFEGEIYRLEGNYLKAIEAYESALAIDPNFAPAQLGLARANRASNPNAEVARLLEQAAASDPNWGEAQLELAGYLIDQGEVQQALAVLDQAEGSAGGSPMFFLRRAQAHLALGDAKAGLEDARKANEMDQTMLAGYRLLALASAMNDDYESAQEAVEVYLSYEKDDPTAWTIQGRALYGAGDYEEALAALDKALAIDKKLAEARLYHGLVLMELGQGQKAVNEIFLAQQSNPRSFLLNVYLARAMLSAGRLGDALQQVNRSYDLARSDAELGQALYWRAQIYEAIGNLYNAVRDWKALIALPEGSVPGEMLETAEEHIKTTSTPAPTATRTPTFTRTSTVTHTPTPTRTSTVTRMPAAPATRTP